MNDYKFGNFLYEKRTAKGLSQAELGSMLGVSNKAVSKWESGAAKPQTAKLVHLAAILDVTVEELLLGEQTAQHQESVVSGTTTSSPKDEMIRQWLHTCRVAKIVTWMLVLTLLQIPFGTGFLIAVLHVNDDVGAAYVLCTLLLLFTCTILTVVYRVSASKQKNTLFRLFAIDSQMLAKATSNQQQSNAPLPKNTCNTIQTLSSSSRIQILHFQKMQLSLLKGWLILAAVPVFLYISLILFSYLPNADWEHLLFVVTVVYVSQSILFIILPVYTVVSCIMIWKRRQELFRNLPDEYQAYREQKKRTATTQTKPKVVAITLYICSMIFSAVRLFINATPSQFWVSAILFLIQFAGIIVVISILVHRITKQMNTCTQTEIDQD